MPRITRPRFSRLAALLVAAVLGLALAAGVSADTPPGRGPGGPPSSPSPTPPAGNCAVLHVQLNGDRPATQTCLAPATDSAASIGGVSCGSNVLQIYESTGYRGFKICFSGSGIVNLGDYRLSWWYPWFSWSDQMSSFSTGSEYVTFYEHKNAGGAKLRYASYQSRSSMPSGWDERVSSLCLWGLTFSCP